MLEKVNVGDDEKTTEETWGCTPRAEAEATGGWGWSKAGRGRRYVPFDIIAPGHRGLFLGREEDI